MRYQRQRQRGVAILTALLVVALSAILVAGLLWRQQVQIRRIDNQRLLDQSQWVARGTFDWIRLILRSEGDTSPITYLGGVWAVPIAETRLSDFLGRMGEARTQQGANIWLSGSIEDAQAKFNLRDLVTSPTPGSLQPDPLAVQRYQRLLSTLGLDSRLASPTAIWLRLSLMSSVTRFATQPGVIGSGGGLTQGNPGSAGLDDGDDNSAGRPLQISSLGGLLDIPGYTPALIERLRPFVNILPVPTPLNLNTAPAEVISSMVPGLSLAGAQGFVASREQAFLLNLADANQRLQLFLPNAGVNAQFNEAGTYDVTTSFFIVHGHIRQDRAELYRTALIFRDALRHSTQIVSVLDQ